MSRSNAANHSSLLSKKPIKQKNSIPTAQHLRALQITQILQKTLQPDTLLALFANELQQNISFDSFHFSFKAKDIDVKIGLASKYSANYYLKLLEEDLGHLTLTRQEKFTESELMDLEYYLTSLLYPLHNAISYSDALHCSLIDVLTQVGNRRALMLALHKEIEIAKRHRQQLSLLMVDIDHFKQLNDELGHLEGDTVIAKIAQTIKATVRESDLVFRYGGDEFIVTLIGTDLKGASLLAERIRQAVNFQLSPYQKKYRKVIGELSASVGVVKFNDQDNVTSFIERADHALYSAKRAGKNQISVYHTRNPAQ